MPIQVEHEGKTITVYTEDEVSAKVDEEVRGLKVTNQNLKDEKKELADKLKGVDEEKRLAEEEKARADGDLEKLQRLMDEKADEQRRAYDKLIGDIRKEKVGNSLSDLVTRLGAGGTKNEDLRDLLKSRFEFDYDTESGQVNVSGDGIASLQDLEKTVLESGRYDAYLAGSQASGGGSPGSQGGGPVTGKKFEQMTGAELSALRKDQPDEYKRLSDEYHNR